MPSRRLLAIVLAVAAVVGLRASQSGQRLFPVSLIPVGVTLHEIDGTRVFISRIGSGQFTAFHGVAPSGDRLAYCPEEEVFTTFERKDLFDEEGRWVAGPSPRDLDQVRLSRPDDVTVEVHPDQIVRATGRSNGTVPGEVGLRYDRFVNPRSYEPAVPFCRGALR